MIGYALPRKQNDNFTTYCILYFPPLSWEKLHNFFFHSIYKNVNLSHLIAIFIDSISCFTVQIREITVLLVKIILGIHP